LALLIPLYSLRRKGSFPGPCLLVSEAWGLQAGLVWFGR
jgi:hypothetical protein